MPLAPWAYRPVTPRPVEADPGQAAEAAILPLVDVEHRPLIEYARMARRRGQESHVGPDLDEVECQVTAVLVQSVIVVQ